MGVVRTQKQYNRSRETSAVTKNVSEAAKVEEPANDAEVPTGS